MSQELTILAEKVMTVPPVVIAVFTFLGFTLEEWVYLVTITWVLLQMTAWVIVRVYKVYKFFYPLNKKQGGRHG